MRISKKIATAAAGVADEIPYNYIAADAVA